ncbi:MAG: hypothetical protein GWN86_29125, partial [Desulfobacterales bacterium]|nr:hypothetical protein [Desulfobacterales bacterium]
MGNTVDFRTNFWTDPRLAGKSGLARALLAYLNTNGHINTAGLYRIGEATISHESGLKVREIRKGFKELSGMVHWDPEAQVVLLIDFVREQFMKTGNISEKMVPSINKSLHDVPEGHHFIGYFLTKYAPLVDSIRRSNPRVPQLEYPYPIMEPPLELSGALSEKYPYSMDRVSVGYTYPTGTERGSGKGSGEGEKEEETETAEVQGNREEYSHKAHSPKHVVDFFHDACIRIRGFKPSISGKRDSQTASRALSMMSYEEVCACIESFLQSGKADAVGITLSIALSDHSINTYRQGR